MLPTLCVFLNMNIFKVLLTNKIVLAVAVAVAAVCPASGESRRLKKIEEADAAIAMNDWEEAAQKLTEAMREDPSDPTNVMLLSNLGMIHFYSGNDSLALVTLTDAHRIAPSSVAVLANRARVLTTMGNFSRAIDDYDSIERMDSMAYQPYLYRGLIYLQTGDIASAASNITKLLDLRPNDVDTHVAAAALAMSQERPSEALPHFSALIAADPQSEYYASRALCHIMLENYIDASDDIYAGLELDSENGELYLYRALMNKRRYRTDDSMADAQRAAQLGVAPSRIKAVLEMR